MASSEAKTVAAYLAELPGERRKAIAAARALVRNHLPKGYKESMGYGMITWTIPVARVIAGTAPARLIKAYEAGRKKRRKP